MFTTTAASFDIESIELPEARKVNRTGQARHLTGEDMQAIFADLPDAKWRAIFAIAYFTGSRISEVLSLQVSDISEDRISFRRENTKTRKPRTAKLLDQLLPYLADYDQPASGYLFPAHHNGKGKGHISRQAADKVLRDTCELVGLDGVSTHSFRRSFATNLYKGGHSIAKISRLLGHSSPTMTARYID